MTWTPQYAERTAGMTRSEVRELLKLLERPEIISFGGGVPEPALFPVKETQAAYDDILGDPKLVGRALQYGVSEGWTPLREQIAATMTAKGVRCDVENILITSGSQQAIDFTARAFVDPGSEMLVQRPTFLGALKAFSAYRPKYVVLPDPKSNEPITASRGADRPRMAYVMADFQNPTGESLTMAERHDVIRLCADLDTPIVEDDPYGELYFEAEPMPTLAAVDLDGRHMDESRTLYCGTFSKTLAPGLRVGWLAAPRGVIERFVMLKQAADIQVSTINQIVVSKLLDSLPANRMDHVRATYRVRRDAMLAALDKHLGGMDISFTRPDGGLFVWLQLPAHANAPALLEKAVAENVAFVPGPAFHHDGGGANTMRLSYSLADAAQIDVGVQRLAKVFRENL
jgi:DNA-binding transcriptional MocR family regulator